MAPCHCMAKPTTASPTGSLPESPPPAAIVDDVAENTRAEARASVAVATPEADADADADEPRPAETAPKRGANAEADDPSASPAAVEPDLVELMMEAMREVVETSTPTREDAEEEEVAGTRAERARGGGGGPSPSKVDAAAVVDAAAAEPTDDAAYDSDEDDVISVFLGSPPATARAPARVAVVVEEEVVDSPPSPPRDVVVAAAEKSPKPTTATPTPPAEREASPGVDVIDAFLARTVSPGGGNESDSTDDAISEFLCSPHVVNPAPAAAPPREATPPPTPPTPTPRNGRSPLATLPSPRKENTPPPPAKHKKSPQKTERDEWKTAVVLYVTSMSAVRATKDKCDRARAATRALGVANAIERDVAAACAYREELRGRLAATSGPGAGKGLVVPYLFVGDVAVAGGDELDALVCDGGLEDALKALGARRGDDEENGEDGDENVNVKKKECGGCGGRGFVVCGKCHGSTRVHCVDVTRRCFACNEVGMTECVACVPAFARTTASPLASPARGAAVRC